MATKIKLGTDGNWAVKENALLAYNDENSVFKPLDMTFDRDSSATRVNKKGLIETVGSNVPRIDYKDGGCPKLLLEPQSTNLCLTSEDFSDANWAEFNAIISSNVLTSPKSDLTADKFIEDGSTNSHFIQDAFALDGTSSYSFSVFAKASERTWIKLDSASNGNWSAGAFFDLQNGVVGTIDSGSAKIEDYGNGWYRCSISGQSNVATTGGALIQLSTDGSTTNYTGNGTSGVYLWGGQIEALSYPTSYIPTNGSIATRVAETASKSGLSSYINSQEGVLYFEAKFIDETGTFLIELNDGTGNNRVSLFSEVGVLKLNCFNGVNNIISYSTDVKNYNKIAIKYSLNNLRFYVNGALRGTDTSFSGFTADLNSIYYSLSSGVIPFYGNVKDLRVYNTALTDAELIVLTS